MSRRNHNRRTDGERGYVLLVFSLFAVLLVIAVYTILPKYVFEGQRQKEDELIFRGQQYVRAIQLFVRKNGRYPLSLDELQSTNGVRFLRQAYPDPMTKDGQWRLIHIGPNGIMDALNPPPQPTTGTGGTQGRNPFQNGIGGPGGLNQNGNSANSNAAGNNGTGNNGGTGLGNAAGNGNIASGSGNGGNSAGGFGNFGANGSNSQNGSNPQTIGSGGAIAGVASKDEDEAIKVVNGFHHYNEWEFIFLYTTDAVAAAKMGAGAPQTPQQQGQQPAPQNPQQPITPPKP